MRTVLVINLSFKCNSKIFKVQKEIYFIIRNYIIETSFCRQCMKMNKEVKYFLSLDLFSACNIIVSDVATTFSFAINYSDDPSNDFKKREWAKKTKKQMKDDGDKDSLEFHHLYCLRNLLLKLIIST